MIEHLQLHDDDRLVEAFDIIQKVLKEDIAKDFIEDASETGRMYPIQNGIELQLDWSEGMIRVQHSWKQIFDYDGSDDILETCIEDLEDLLKFLKKKLKKKKDVDVNQSNV